MKSTNSRTDISPERAIEANIHVHSQLARTGEYARSPHFRPENRQHVRRILESLIRPHLGARPWRAIDFGCGTGFLIDLMHDLIDRIDGIDITPEMMRQVDLSPGNIHLHESRAESTPFPDETFDFATSYSFMDHLFDYRPFITEAARVLRVGGVFFSDLNPNRAFIDAISQAASARGSALEGFPVVHREVEGALNNGQYYERSLGVDAAMLEAAEPIKTLSRGFDATEVMSFAKDVGFSQVRVEYEWFLGQGPIINGERPKDAEVIRQYLRLVEPVAGHLFKYLRFVFIK
ncbi:MAG: methyltransferase domain-containing protein [Gammaproteobacteria bacterium]|nr:methyltransferase domain-containing protein [Gammaproteobacteria bacterium]